MYIQGWQNLGEQGHFVTGVLVMWPNVLFSKILIDE